MSDDIVDMIRPTEENYGSIRLRKPTAGTLSLCDFAKLKIASGGASEVPFFEAIAFFYIHSQDLGAVKEKLFDKSLGKNDEGCTIAFINEVVEWADKVELGDIGAMGEKIGTMLTEAMNPKAEPLSQEANEDQVASIVGDKPKKKAKPRPPS